MYAIQSKYVAGLVMHMETNGKGPAKATTIYDGGNGRSFVEQTETQAELNKLYSYHTSYNTVKRKPSFQIPFSQLRDTWYAASIPTGSLPKIIR